MPKAKIRTEIGSLLVDYLLNDGLAAIPMGSGAIENTVPADSQILTAGGTHRTAKDLKLPVQGLSTGIAGTHAAIISGLTLRGKGKTGRTAIP